MHFKNLIYAILASCIISSFSVAAKTVDILGITTDGHNGQIKARLDLNGKSLSDVRTYSYNMTDGFTITNTAYSIVEDDGTQYLSADVAYYPDEDGYTYRIELIFADGDHYISEVVDRNLTTAFMWLGDYQYAQGVSGWDSAHPPVVDKEIDSSLQLTLDGTVYYKAVCNHAPGYLVYKFDEDFTKFVTRYGVQDTQADGDIEFIFYKGSNPDITGESGLETVARQIMYSKTNPERKGEPCVRDLEFDMTGVKVLRFQMNQIDNNWGDHGHLALARLYLPDSTPDPKQSQTVTFKTEGGNLNGEIVLDASASSNGKVYYNIISGREYAEINDNKIRPLWGGKGIVVVEATQFGDDRYYPATSYISFNVDQRPRVEMLDIYHPSIKQDDNGAFAYLLIDAKGKDIDKLNVEIFNNPKKLESLGVINLLDKYDNSKDAQVIEIPVAEFQDKVLQVVYSYSDSDSEITLPYWHKEGAYDYLSDFDRSKYTVGMGYGSFPGPNLPFEKMNNGVLEIGNYTTSLQVYKKGFGIHASGYVNVAPEYLSPYDRIITDIGAQKNGNANYGSQKLTFQLYNGNTLLADTVDVLKPGIQFWDFPINNMQPLRIVGNEGSDRNSNDYVCIGAPRLYYTRPVKTPQTINWDNERRIINNKATEVELVATSESGFPIFYHIVSGKEYAVIWDGKLIINELPVGGLDIIVDAFQPGNDVWGASNIATCVFGLVRGREVHRDEYLELNGSDTLDELVIYADKLSSGQVGVKNGIVDVKKIILKYTFNPDEWVHIAFPSDLDIDKVSNLKTLGYSFNAFGAPAYFIKEYNGNGTDPDSGEEIWQMLDSPIVKANTGYIMSIDGSISEQPVEVTFTIDNSNLDLVDIMRSLSLTVDFSGMQPNSKQSVTVASVDPDIKSNNLTIEVSFQPDDTTKLPLNYEKALENMRYVFVSENKAMRLTLPDQSPARVVIFNKDGNKVLKAIRYIAPYVIDLSDLKAGVYNMVVEYGNAVKSFKFEL